MKKLKPISNKTIQEEIIPTIALAMDDKKAQDIVLMDLTEIKGASFDYFIICNADSPTLVHAIANNVEDRMLTVCQQKPWHSEGFTNSEWILLDYGSVVAHIFRTDLRDHYQLEKLWADAKITQMDKKIEIYYKKENEHTKPAAGRKSTGTKSTPPTGRTTKPTKPTKSTTGTRATRTTKSKPAK